MKIKIYQITPEKDARGLMFMRLSFAQRHGGVDASEYELAFEGDVPARDLEAVYMIFNDYAKRPAGYCGRSLSVSDVVVVAGMGTYFCDSYGWTKLSESEWPLEEVCS